MIKTLSTGTYKLSETKGQTKLLELDDHAFAWVNAAEIGEILITSHKEHSLECILAAGKYRLYEVKDEPELTDLQHLELFVGEGLWQGYLLPTGLPTDTKKRNRIIPTTETITISTH